MTLVSSIVTDAYREGNMIALGKSPNANQVTEALRLLNAIFSAIYGDDAGENLQDFPLGAFDQDSAQCTYPMQLTTLQNPPINARLLATAATAMTVYLSARPQDGSRYGIADPYGRLAAFPVTLDANGRTIDGNPTLQLATNGTFAEWFYRSDLGQWVKLTDVDASDEMPFPKDFDSLFVIMLAMRINPRYGRSLDIQSQAILKSGRTSFIARYLQSRPLLTDDSISWPFMSLQSYNSGRAFSSTQGFAAGRPWGN